MIPRRRLTAVHFQSVERRIQRNLEGLANVRLDPDELPGCRAATLTFFFFFLMLTRRRGLGERGDKILRWRHSNCTHCDACRRETAECSQRRSEVRAGKLSSRFRLRAYRTVQTRPVSIESKRTPRDFPRLLFLYPLPSAAARTAPNGVKERASFCLVFRSLNSTSSHRMFSMGYRRAKSTQGNTNFQKKFFVANNFGITTRGP